MIADVGFSIRAAALAFGLDFVPLVEERFDLALPSDLEGDARVVRLRSAAEAHVTAGMAGVDSGEYMGEHWLATFALLALTA